MNLSRLARKFYVQQITTDPPVAGWMASFDDGTTWTAGELVSGTTDTWRWLVRGPDFDPAGFPAAVSTLITGPVMQPLLRATDDPEVEVTNGTSITLT